MEPRDFKKLAEARHNGSTDIEILFHKAIRGIFQKGDKDIQWRTGFTIRKFKDRIEYTRISKNGLPYTFCVYIDWHVSLTAVKNALSGEREVPFNRADVYFKLVELGYISVRIHNTSYVMNIYELYATNSITASKLLELINEPDYLFVAEWINVKRRKDRDRDAEMDKAMAGMTNKWVTSPEMINNHSKQSNANDMFVDAIDDWAKRVKEAAKPVLLEKGTNYMVVAREPISEPRSVHTVVIKEVGAKLYKMAFDGSLKYMLIEDFNRFYMVL